jgi:hypothetical protein
MNPGPRYPDTQAQLAALDKSLARFQERQREYHRHLNVKTDKPFAWEKAFLAGAEVVERNSNEQKI